ncbi:hypothetical protein P175DRAFT_0470051 [Aspergillus ochraceoroseus IBT 24754]|uniref:Very-long-chain (3R)-3-hydroxyacyl-CoA dehydratase n=3 Tax=Aspergillus subgen. Nidulantes TaxID=2720870 RepID=A0A0F8U694_9EURO|nr:uncharacterized protein P175DRAFT_0470051 [Aspergillus ochraceoroseus IBT 24754]KKK15118.1 hypothetical protein ARAM_006308 [Aspergillus rambellii]KKK17158.1 hypothetical protein AOCH_007183 [Aspergillus ochraceoroseus]PTU24260.1 hypothetical protein P175DRAFT_0470051 [Aspergillus ochraceoroseus IBT 24754]
MSSKPSSPAGLTRLYLLAYNALNFALWTTCTVTGFRLVLAQAVTSPGTLNLPSVFNEVFSPLLITTQSLAALEILHSLLGIVRAPFLTTAMQVASRLFVVWGVLFLFHEQGDGRGVVGGPTSDAKFGDYAFLGCLAAWGVTEMIRYGFFVLQVWGSGVPAWWNWLRYNTFYVLYPIGIASECTLALVALPNAAALHPLYWAFIIAVLAIYVPGSYVMYTHMMKQKRKSNKKQQ